MNTASAAHHCLKRLQHIEAAAAALRRGELTRTGRPRTKEDWIAYVQAHDQAAVAAQRVALRSREQECENLFRHPEERGPDADG